MSSFINKSGKKVAPKAPPRRRLGAAAAAPSNLAQSRVEPSPTPQPNEIAVSESTSQATLAPEPSRVGQSATPDAPEVSESPPPIRPPVVGFSGIPVIQSSGRGTGSRASSETHSINASLADVTPNLRGNGVVAPIITVSTVTRIRSISPSRPEDVTASRPAKRQRVEEVVDVIQQSGSRIEVVRGDSRSPIPPAHSTSSAPSRSSQSRDDGIPQVVSSGPPKVRVSKISGTTQKRTPSSNEPPVIHSSSRLSQSSTNTEPLVPYETPRQTTSSRTGQSSTTARTPTSAPTATSTSTSAPTVPKPRVKGSRKDQWQVSTPADLASGKGKRKSRKPATNDSSEPPEEEEEENDDNDEINQPSVVTKTPKPRKTRKDKGKKKNVDKIQLVSSLEPMEVSDDDENGNYLTIDRRPSTVEQQTTATMQVNPVVEIDRPSSQQGTPTTEREERPDEEQAHTSAASKRLANLQKRKAKQVAKNAAISRSIARANAIIIDNAVAQSVEESSRTPISRAKSTPTFAVSSQTPNRGATVESDRATSTAATEFTEGGTVVQKRRSKRASTPLENESVFIIESKTQMWDLAKRDTENRVGFKSEREKLMRQIDWDDVKIKQRAEDERLARQARGKRAGDSEVYDPEDEGLDEDEVLSRAVARNKNKRPGLQITLMANGEHVIDEQSQMIDRQALHDVELDMLEEVEEDDLTKKFNTQTYVTWRRKDENERVMVHEKWNFEATERFYDALATFGTDFMIISKLFPGRTRRHIKAKFVREERSDPERIRDALTGHAARKHPSQGWDLETFRLGAGLAAEAFVDPRKVEEDLRRERMEREKEIEEQRAETMEEERQRKLAGVLAGDDEVGSDGEILSSGEVIKRAAEQARKKKLERLGEKKRKIFEMAGGEEEIVETIEDD